MTSKIEQQVMASVAVVYTARQLLSRRALEIYALAASALALWQLVWVHKVFENFVAIEKNGLDAVTTYLFVAVTQTHLAVQLTLVVATVAFIFLIVDTVRSASDSSARAFA
ncbi:MAG: hypothetical protein Q7S26_00085 [bacterium]|nr:hypothetical protein [bacterium]